MSKAIWSCRIGEINRQTLPGGADFPMREAVRKAYREITGKEPEFVFSGWGGTLTESERALVDQKTTEKKEGRFVIQGPDQSGFAGPWSIWDSLTSSFDGTKYVDDPIVTGIPTKEQAEQALKRLEGLFNWKPSQNWTTAPQTLELVSGGSDERADRLNYLIAHAPPMDGECREQTTPEEQARHAVRFAKQAQLLAEQEDYEFTGAVLDIARERYRQISSEGWSPSHDDAHVYFTLSKAGAAYALNVADAHYGSVSPEGSPPTVWPFEESWWKPKDRRSDLVRAAALIAAEIDRMDRAGIH